ncbi:hypothetical protein SESBI_22331 [Sesbania bispinosa]|nr:hypothetical protein SESBI_22331 [Sesbania bispinosa]
MEKQSGPLIQHWLVQDTSDTFLRRNPSQPLDQQHSNTELPGSYDQDSSLPVPSAFLRPKAPLYAQSMRQLVDPLCAVGFLTFPSDPICTVHTRTIRVLTFTHNQPLDLHAA